MKKHRLLFLIFVFSACSHTPPKLDAPPPPALNLRPPELAPTTPQDRLAQDQLLMQLNLTHPEKNVQWYTNFRRAQLWSQEKPQLACELYAALSGESLFPLHEVARVRAFESCTTEQVATFRLGRLEWQKSEPYLRDTAREAALKRAATDNNRGERLRLLLEKSRANLPATQRLEVLAEVLNLAEIMHDEKAKAEAHKRQFRLAPRLQPDPPANEWLNVAQDFRRHREFAKAEEIYERVLRDSRRTVFEKVQAFRGLRQSLKLAQKKERFIEVSLELAGYVARKLPKMRGNPEFMRVYQDVTLDVARALWTHGHGGEARNLIAQIQATLHGRGNMADAYLILGRMAEERKDNDAALDAFQKALNVADSPAARTRLLWFVAWNQRKVGHLDDAIVSLEKLRTMSEDPFARNRTTFWLAKSLLSQGDKARGQVELEQLIQDDPSGYYGLLAYRELKRPIPTRHVDKPEMMADPNPRNSKLADIYDVNSLNWLISVEERGLARNYLDLAADKVRAQKMDVAAWSELFAQYVRAENYAALTEQLGRLGSNTRAELLEQNSYFLFPQPYAEIVSKSAAQFNLSEELIYSIMRQESSFNPSARSTADAFGLMQVLPELATKTQAEARVSFSQDEELFQPEINIPIGAAYLSQLSEHYHGQFVLIVANYNAAEDAILTWVNTRWRGDTLEFIEDIPYEETRGYVRLVMRNLIFYLGLKAGPEGLAFPEWVLNVEPLKT